MKDSVLLGSRAEGAAVSVDLLRFAATGYATAIAPIVRIRIAALGDGAAMMTRIDSLVAALRRGDAFAARDSVSHQKVHAHHEHCYARHM